jgi:hypothetical protein
MGSPESMQLHSYRRSINAGGASRRAAPAAVVAVAEADAAAAEIIGRDLDDHPVADAGADAKLAHLARHIGEQLMLVVEHDAVVAVRQNPVTVP